MTRLLPLQKLSKHFAGRSGALRVPSITAPKSASAYGNYSTGTRAMTPSSSYNYNTWSNAELIERVTQLEVQLRAQNEKHSISAAASPAPVKKKSKKASSAFDASRYATRHIALKFAYLGAKYNGFEHHSNNTTPLPTVEEELWKALMKTKLIFPVFRTGQSEEEVCWDGCDYSKCGRTDKGVSAFGQVIGIRVRSNRPLNSPRAEHGDTLPGTMEPSPSPPPFDDVRDEIPYIQNLNRVLPDDIRVLAWCPNPPEGFSARFNCTERRYRYFFTNPAYPPLPGHGGSGDGWLDLDSMRIAARKYEGLHDFRNFCKVDASKQITNFQRRVFHSDIHEVSAVDEPASFVGKIAANAPQENGHFLHHTQPTAPKLYWFEVRGSAFLWHQVRHLVAVLFLIGQGFEDVGLVDKLLDPVSMPAKPHYEMAHETPLVLWDCIFSADQSNDEGRHDESAGEIEHRDTLHWVYVGDRNGGQHLGKRQTVGVDDGRFGRNGVIENVWSLWQQRKIDEVLAGSLMDVIAALGKTPTSSPGAVQNNMKHRTDVNDMSNARLFDGSGSLRGAGTYVPLIQRPKMEPPDIVNARYAKRKGLDTTAVVST